jgi:ferredoxin
MAEKWPNLTRKKDPMPECDEFLNKPGKKELVSQNPGEGS